MKVSRHTLLSSTARLRGIVLASVVASAFGACSLNPQPIPPGYSDDERAGATSGDASKSPPPWVADAASSFDDADGTGGGDAGGLRNDAGPPGPFVDAGTDARTDAGPETDAGADAGDGSTDAAFDGPVDALAD